jgi:hypothetical protein
MADIRTRQTVEITVRPDPGEVILTSSVGQEMYSLARLDLTVYRAPSTGLIRTHIEYDQFRVWRRRVDGKGWTTQTFWPGFFPRAEMLPTKLVDEISAAYLDGTWNSTATGLPMFDVINGKAL